MGKALATHTAIQRKLEANQARAQLAKARIEAKRKAEQDAKRVAREIETCYKQYQPTQVFNRYEMRDADLTAAEIELGFVLSCADLVQVEDDTLARTYEPAFCPGCVEACGQCAD